MPTSNTESTHAGTRRVSASPRFARTGQMVNCLREELLYTEKRPRDMLFAAIARTVADAPEGTLIVARLTREAAARARSEAEGVGFQFANWNTAAKAAVNALLSSESLLDPSGEPIATGVAAHAAVVGSLREDYEDRTEAFLLEVLLRRLGDVTVHDHTALAHALFRQFDPNVPMHDLEDRVAILLARLADRVTMDGDRYVVREF
jgi:hypothetical protein